MEVTWSVSPRGTSMDADGVVGRVGIDPAQAQPKNLSQQRRRVSSILKSFCHKRHAAYRSWSRAKILRSKIRRILISKNINNIEEEFAQAWESHYPALLTLWLRSSISSRRWRANPRPWSWSLSWAAAKGVRHDLRCSYRW